MKMGELVVFCQDLADDWLMGIVPVGELVIRVQTCGVRWSEIKTVLKVNGLWTPTMVRLEEELSPPEDKFFG